MTPPGLRVRVHGRNMQTPHIVSLVLVNATGAELPAFTAGAHIDVHLPNGLIRQYSLCNSPSERHRYVIGVLRDANTRGGSAAVHALKEGDEIHISLPRNHFPLVTAAHTTLVAGGIGVTPLLAMAEQMVLDGSSFDIHLCTRSPEHTPFASRWAAPEFAGRVHFHHDGGEASRRVDLATLLGRPASGLQVYVCGPGGFIDAVLSAGRAAGFADGQLHREYFSAAPVTPVFGDSAFSVVLEKSGLTIEIPVGVTIVEALRERGIELLVSCEQGVCGTCLTRVTAGTPDHRDMFLTDEEHALNDQMTVCCSRSLTPSLTLDI
ncbi:MAG: oxidoreductase [Polaromonas sp.]|uniref:PDR/VanB family oxidoreductase n=1 Tax=Polaromonas sp. TaxID=1869339 RepID=UPI0025F8C7B8|nr:PDR/VanB family oxidoreductase [Polaromonas sp.]MBI2726449.1 oxidoreductase [Polaromonas sp.]